MSIENNVSRITLDRDIKLRKWGSILFILVSFANLISLLWATDISLSLPFLYAIYIIVTLYILRFEKVDIFSPLMFFVFFSFLGFGLKLPLLSLFPDTAYFASDPSYYHYNFRYNSAAITYAFVVFLVGYVAFIIGSNTIKKGLRIRIYERSSHPLGLAILSVILIIASFYFRAQYHVGVPGYYAGSIEHAGYIYYPLMYGSLIATCLMFYSALIRKSAIYTLIGLSLFVLSALLAALLGWKGGSALSILCIILIYYYVNRHKQNVGRKIHRRIMFFLLLLVLLFVLLYQFISYYRTVELASHSGVSLSRFYSDLQKFGNERNVDSGKVVSSALLTLLNRSSGLDNLVGITAYFQDRGESIHSPFFFLSLLSENIQPEKFYTWYIMGNNPNAPTTFAPTGCGSLYICGGIIGVIMGMIFLGILSKLLYLTFMSNICRDGRWIIFYTIFMTNIFSPVVFEGTMIDYFRKNFVALLFVYAFFIFMLNIVHPIKYTKKLFEEGKP